MPSKPSRGLLGTPHLAAVGKLSAATIALSLTPLVEQAAAAELGVGAVSTLGYASKLTALVSNLGVAAVGVAVFPYFSELLARGQIAQCWSTLRRYALAVVGAGCVLTLGLIALSDPIVRLLFMRGAFDELAAGAVSVAQQAYLLQIPGALLLALCSRLLLANGNAREVAIVSVGQLVLFAVLVVIGLQAWRSPAVIALAYSIAGSACAAVALLLSREALKRAEERAA
jgi:peptidoglycan biosynthesis protein MviN/MurJ (putative lipid II flippase)